MTTRPTIKTILNDICQLPGQRALRAALRADDASYQGTHAGQLARATLRLIGLWRMAQTWSREYRRNHGRRAVLADWFAANADAWHEALCEAGRALAGLDLVYSGAGDHTDRILEQAWGALDRLALLYVGSKPLPRSPADEAALQRMYVRVMEAVHTTLGPLQPGDGVEIANAVEQWLGGGA